MEIVKVTLKKELNVLYKDCALTIIGLSEESFPKLIDFLKQHTTVYRERLFVISGKTMNEKYHLTGDNVYKEHLHIVCVSLEDIDADGIIFPRFEIGGRWFNDVVDNNARREKAQQQERDREREMEFRRQHNI